MAISLSEILLLEPGSEIRIGDGAPGVNFTGIRIKKTISGFGFETYENDVLVQWVDEHGVLQQTDATSGSSAMKGVQMLEGNLLLAASAFIRSISFVSGMLGSGFQIARDPDGLWAMEIDRMRVRGSLAVMELLFQQVRATNGSIWVSSTGKVKNFRGLR